VGVLARWKVGALALDLMRSARDLIGSADLSAALSVLLQIVTLERDETIDGRGKLAKLIAWFVQAWPQYTDAAYVLRDFATAAVALFKAVELFRSRGAA